MARVTVEEVKAIIVTTLPDDVIQVWIDVAHSIVNANEECINGDEALLTQIELMLSCHFVYLNSGSGDGSSVTSRKADMLTTTYSRAQVSDSINESTYGTAANALSGGCLANYDAKKIKFFSAGGDCEC